MKLRTNMVKISDTVRAIEGGVELAVHCQPGAARRGLMGTHGTALKIKVRSPAGEGRANQELLSLLSEILGIPEKRIRLVTGERSRIKRVTVGGIGVAKASELLLRAVAQTR